MYAQKHSFLLLKRLLQNLPTSPFTSHYCDLLERLLLMKDVQTLSLNGIVLCKFVQQRTCSTLLNWMLKWNKSGAWKHNNSSECSSYRQKRKVCSLLTVKTWKESSVEARNKYLCMQRRWLKWERKLFKKLKSEVYVCWAFMWNNEATSHSYFKSLSTIVYPYFAVTKFSFGSDWLGWGWRRSRSVVFFKCFIKKKTIQTKLSRV